jgi:hypothetical protein
MTKLKDITDQTVTTIKEYLTEDLALYLEGSNDLLWLVCCPTGSDHRFILRSALIDDRVMGWAKKHISEDIDFGRIIRNKSYLGLARDGVYAGSQSWVAIFGDPALLVQEKQNEKIELVQTELETGSIYLFDPRHNYTIRGTDENSFLLYMQFYSFS